MLQAPKPEISPFDTARRAGWGGRAAGWGVCLALGLLAGCERPIVERTPEALAQAARAQNPPSHEGTTPASALRLARRSASGTGRIAEVDLANGRVTILHEPGTEPDWPELGVTFDVRPPSLLRGVKAGDRVTFHLEARGDAPEIVALQAR